ncbi:MAG TPA: DUF433 domain-containing protein [Mycobacteriales bacterium]|nr:DUF433 domain-containing protein [Mycobacteriales bacterium]
MQVDRISVDSGIMGGVPCIRGTRIPVVTLIGMLAAGLDTPAILAEYPELTETDVRAALEFAALVIEDLPPSVPGSP